MMHRSLIKIASVAPKFALPKALPKAVVASAVRFQSSMPYTPESVTAVHFKRSAVPHPLVPKSAPGEYPTDRQLADRTGRLQVHVPAAAGPPTSSRHANPSACMQIQTSNPSSSLSLTWPGRTTFGTRKSSMKR